MIKANHVVGMSVVGLSIGFFWYAASGSSDLLDRGVGEGFAITSLIFAILAWLDQVK